MPYTPGRVRELTDAQVAQVEELEHVAEMMTQRLDKKLRKELQKKLDEQNDSVRDHPHLVNLQSKGTHSFTKVTCSSPNCHLF